ncbi:hypothetical protein ACFVVM_32740 [Nocardia sp. NPDC058176]
MTVTGYRHAASETTIGVTVFRHGGTARSEVLGTVTVMPDPVAVA